LPGTVVIDVERQVFLGLLEDKHVIGGSSHDLTY
jgi:hypothetical protein